MKTYRVVVAEGLLRNPDPIDVVSTAVAAQRAAFTGETA